MSFTVSVRPARRAVALGFVALTAACAAESSRGVDSAGVARPAGIVDSAAGTTIPAAADTLRAPAASGPHAARLAELRNPASSPVLRGLYVNRFAAHSSRRMKWLLGVADSTEINALVVDVKDEFGLNYRPANAAYQKYISKDHGIIRNVKALTDSIHAHGVVAIARIVVFKDPAAAALNEAWTIRRPDGTVWRDEKGNAWVNPYHRDVWEYNFAVAEELVRLGFDEIQWDYIRFPEPYSRLPKQVFPGANGITKPDNLANFLKLAQERMHKAGVRSTADVFGLVTTVRGPLEIGQWWEKVAPVTDVLLPMTYPSHYPRGSYGVARPNAEPYRIVKAAIDGARERNQKLGITDAEHVRPWIQAFSLGQPPYDHTHVMEQKRAIYDAGFKGWVLWHPGSKYEPFIQGLEKETP
ncbi:MAG TPA: putative glycoside hydrolase [Gemmatimonadaceae bacterium]|nr:putative glycoside hydrolase [Gemmatimonadaceae bacterium]